MHKVNALNLLIEMAKKGYFFHFFFLFCSFKSVANTKIRSHTIFTIQTLHTYIHIYTIHADTTRKW